MAIISFCKTGKNIKMDGMKAMMMVLNVPEKIIRSIKILRLKMSFLNYEVNTLNIQKYYFKIYIK